MQSQAFEPILDSKTAFDILGHSEYIVKLYLKATDDVTSQVKGQSFDYMSSLAATVAASRAISYSCQVKVMQGYESKGSK